MDLSNSKYAKKFAFDITLFFIGFALVWALAHTIGKIHQGNIVTQNLVSEAPITYILTTGRNYSERISFIDGNKKVIVECNSLPNDFCHNLKTNAKISQATYLFIPEDCSLDNSQTLEECFGVISTANFMDSQSKARPYQPHPTEIQNGLDYISSKNYFAWLIGGFLVVFIFVIFKAKWRKN